MHYFSLHCCSLSSFQTKQHKKNLKKGHRNYNPIAKSALHHVIKMEGKNHLQANQLFIYSTNRRSVQTNLPSQKQSSYRSLNKQGQPPPSAGTSTYIAAQGITLRHQFNFKATSLLLRSLQDYVNINGQTNSKKKKRGGAGKGCFLRDWFKSIS